MKWGGNKEILQNNSAFLKRGDFETSSLRVSLWQLKIKY